MSVLVFSLNFSSTVPHFVRIVQVLGIMRGQNSNLPKRKTGRSAVAGGSVPSPLAPTTLTHKNKKKLGTLLLLAVLSAAKILLKMCVLYNVTVVRLLTFGSVLIA